MIEQSYQGAFKNTKVQWPLQHVKEVQETEELRKYKERWKSRIIEREEAQGCDRKHGTDKEVYVGRERNYMWKNVQ